MGGLRPLHNIVADFLLELRPLGETTAERLYEAVVTLTSFRPCSGLACIRQGRRRAQPESDEQRHGLDRDTGVPLQPLHAAVDAVEPLADDSPAALLCIRREERGEERKRIVEGKSGAE